MNSQMLEIGTGKILLAMHVVIIAVVKLSYAELSKVDRELTE